MFENNKYLRAIGGNLTASVWLAESDASYVQYTVVYVVRAGRPLKNVILPKFPFISYRTGITPEKNSFGNIIF